MYYVKICYNAMIRLSDISEFDWSLRIHKKRSSNPSPQIPIRPSRIKRSNQPGPMTRAELETSIESLIWAAQKIAEKKNPRRPDYSGAWELAEQWKKLRAN